MLTALIIQEIEADLEVRSFDVLGSVVQGMLIRIPSCGHENKKAACASTIVRCILVNGSNLI